MLDASDIEVSVEQGEVTLRGYVPDRQAKRLAEDIVDFVAGVKDVHNQIRIRGRSGKA
jgi:osmotically-inducible protein OsmY